MHNWLASTVNALGLSQKSEFLPKGISAQAKPRTSWKQAKSTSVSPATGRSAFSSTSQLSKVSTNSASSVATGLSTEELDCFRSMRGTSINSTSTLNTAMSSDAQELADRLHSVQHAGERHKKVFDSGGQGYSILVTHEEVRVCHVDEKGEYHYQHLPLPAPRRPAAHLSRRNSNTDKEDGSAASSTQPSRAASRATSTERKQDKPKKQSRRQLVKDHDGRTLVDITPHSVTVFHDGGVWRCHRMLGKIWDSDYATHVTARMPRAWSRRPSSNKKRSSVVSALDEEELRRVNGWSDDAAQDGDNQQDAVELLLCSNTPGERGTAPRAFKSYYHDL